MPGDNREHWPTIGRKGVADRLVTFGVPEDKARAMDPRQAVRRMRELEARNERLSNCDIGAVLAEMRRFGVAPVEANGEWKLRSADHGGTLWMLSVRPALSARKDEIVAAWGGPAAEVEHCVKCLAAVYDPGAGGACCEFILSCPYLGRRTDGDATE